MIETKKAHELDIVELTEDLPEFGLRKGERGTVVEAFDSPEEAYMLEFVDESGASSRLAYGVKPNQVKNISDIAKEYYARGITYLQKGETIEAAREIRRAVKLIPSYIRLLHQTLCIPLAKIEDWTNLRKAILFIRLIDPTYEYARYNLAISYLNDGAQEANKGNYEKALTLFYSALRVESPSNIVSLIKENLASSYTLLGIQAHKRGDFKSTVTHMEGAFTFNPNERTRHDLGVAYFYAAMFYSDKGDLQEAITYYRQAEDTGLISSEVLNNHACILAEQGEIDEAILYLESALALAPEDAVVQSNLSKLVIGKVAVDLSTKTDVEFYPVPSMNVAELSVA
jgi:tetratricopeptide (TPR) repeat protein